MLEKRSLRGPIVLGVVMIVAVIVLGAVWIVSSLLTAMDRPVSRGLVWAMLTTGTVLLVGVLAGVIAYLTLTVKAFNLNRRQSNFIDSVTHELKSPIASLKLYLQTMTRRSVDPQQQAHFHRTMLEDVERLDSLINHLLDAARIERGIEPAPTTEIRLDSLLQQCVQAACLRYRVPLESVQLRCDQVTVKSQLVQLEILYRNLIDNAVKYAGSPPQVEVDVQFNSRGDVVVRISDNGQGIPTEQRRKVFGRFVRLGSELERSKPGTGLGLYLVRNVVQSLGGTVRIRERGNLPGTEFEVTLREVFVDVANGESETAVNQETPPANESYLDTGAAIERLANETETDRGTSPLLPE